MGKNKKKFKRKASLKPASYKTETAAQYTSNSSQLETDEKKFTNYDRFSDDVAATGQYPENITEGNKVKKDNQRSSGSIIEEEKSSKSLDIEQVDNKLKSLVDSILCCIKNETNIRERALSKGALLKLSEKLNSFTLKSLQVQLSEILACRNPKVVQFVKKYITSQPNFIYLRDCLSSVVEENRAIESSLYISASDSDDGTLESAVGETKERNGRVKILPKMTLPKNVEKRMSSVQRKSGSASIEMKYRQFRVLFTSDDHKDKCMNSQSEKTDLKCVQNRISSAQETLKTATKSDEPNELQKVEKNYETDMVRSEDNTQKEHSLHEFQGEKGKDNTRFNEDIQPNGQSPQNKQLVHDNLVKKSKDVPKVNFYKVMEHISSAQNLQSRGSKLGKDAMKLRATDSALKFLTKNVRNLSPEKETITAVEDIDAIISQEATDEVNNVIEELKKIEIWENNKSEENSIDYIRKTAHSLQNVAEDRKEKRGTEGSDVSARDVQTTGKSSQNATEFKEEQRKDAKNINRFTEDVQTARKSSQNLTGHKKKVAKNINGSIGIVQTDRHSSQKAAESRTEGRKNAKDISMSTGSFKLKDSSVYPDFVLLRDALKIVNNLSEGFSKEGVIEERHSNAQANKISPKKIKSTKSSEEFTNDLKCFLTLQNSKLDEQMIKSEGEKCKLKILKEDPDVFSIKKEIVASPAEARYEKVITPETKDDTIEEISATAEKDDESDEVVIRMNKKEDIFFEFESNGSRHIKASGNDFYFSDEKLKIIFHFKDENVQVAFIGGQIFVSTQNNEFDISVRKPQPEDLNENSTQTDADLNEQ